MSSPRPEASFGPAQWLTPLLMGGLTAISAWWLWQFPLQLSNDDALFFSRGVDHFSVLELSPHFPGYPAYLALAKLLHLLIPSPQAVILGISRVSVLLLPWLSYGLLARLCGRRLALLGFLLTASDPLLLGLGLQGLSDAPALCWLAAAFWAQACRRHWLAGLLLGLCLATRPSYLPLLLPWLLWFSYRHRSGALLLPLAGVGLASAAFLFWHDGWGYLLEGRRFIEGHFSLWGNSALGSEQPRGWGQVLAGYLPIFSQAALLGGALWVAALALNFTGLSRPIQALLLVLGAALLWTGLAQNPENLRHLAPILWLSYLLVPVALQPARRPGLVGATATLLVLANLWLAAGQLQWRPAPPPLHQAIAALESRHPRLLASNHGIELLREALPGFAVADSFYSGNAQRVLNRGGFRLTGTPLRHQSLELLSRFPARNPAEQGLWLYRLRTAPD